MLLKNLGSGWDSDLVDANSIVTNSALLREAKELLCMKLESYPKFVVKDPRISTLIDFWSTVFSDLEEVAVYYLLAIRNPLGVASSLVSRDGQSRERWLDLWYDTNRKIFHTIDSQYLHIVEFEKLIVAPRAQINRISEYLEEPINEQEFVDFSNNFLEVGLVHNDQTETFLGANAAVTFYESWDRRSQSASSVLFQIDKDSLAAERDSLVTERDSLVTERDALMNSGSWRITSGGRAVWRLLRGA
jgi:hypothetical protein